MIMSANIRVLLSLSETDKSPYIKSNFDEIKYRTKRAITKLYSKMTNGTFIDETKETFLKNHIDIHFTDVNNFIEKSVCVHSTPMYGNIELQDYSTWQMMVTVADDSMSIYDGKKLFETIMSELGNRDIVVEKYYTECFIRCYNQSWHYQSPMLMFYQDKWAKLNETVDWEEAKY